MTPLSCYRFALLQIVEQLLNMIWKCVLWYGLRSLHVWGFSIISATLLLQKEGQRISEPETKISLHSGFIFSLRIMNQRHVSLTIALSVYQQENVLTIMIFYCFWVQVFLPPMLRISYMI